MCVQYKKTPELFSGNEMQTGGGRTSEVTLIPRTNFVGRGITITDTLIDKVTLSYRVSQGSVLAPLFALYTTPRSTIISSFYMNHHLYSDDIQIYMSLSSKQSLREVTTLFNGCIGLDNRVHAVA